MIRVGRNAVAFFDLGQELIDEESGVFIREIIVFEAAIETWLRASTGGGNDARVDEYPIELSFFGIKEPAVFGI